MLKNPIDNPVTERTLKRVLRDYPTKKDLEEALDKRLSDYPTKKELKEELRKESASLKDWVSDGFEHVIETLDEHIREYRDEIMTKMDGIVGELQTMRGEITVGFHQDKEQLDDHEKRITKLEARKN